MLQSVCLAVPTPHQGRSRQQGRSSRCVIAIPCCMADFSTEQACPLLGGLSVLLRILYHLGCDPEVCELENASRGIKARSAAATPE